MNNFDSDAPYLGRPKHSGRSKIALSADSYRDKGGQQLETQILALQANNILSLQQAQNSKLWRNLKRYSQIVSILRAGKSQFIRLEWNNWTKSRTSYLRKELTVIGGKI